MKCSFVYDWVAPVDIPEGRLVGVFEPMRVQGGGEEARAIREGMAAPIGAARLREEVRAAGRILVLADDASRPTPAHKLLPYVLEELAAAGKDERHVSFLMSLGTHRAMTDAEIDAKLGLGVRERFRVENHAWEDVAGMVSLGRTRLGNEIRVNRRLVEADYVIGIGNIVPHPAAGFAGGGKIVDPGCVSEETCGAFHWESVKYPAREVIGVRDNPMTAMIDEVAARAGLRFIVNTVLDAAGRIVRVVAGHPVEAHRAGCRTAVEVYGVRIPEPADIVVCDSHPADLEMWQAIKGLCTADLCMKNGGVVIMATPCPEGASAEHPELERYGYRNFVETSELVRTGKVSMVVGHHMVQGGATTGQGQGGVPGVEPAVARHGSAAGFQARRHGGCCLCGGPADDGSGGAGDVPAERCGVVSGGGVWSVGLFGKKELRPADDFGILRTLKQAYVATQG